MRGNSQLQKTFPAFLALVALLHATNLARAGTPDEIIRGIGFEQRLGVQLPLDLMFTDESGREVRLGKYFGQKPVVLALVYYECPMLCTQVLNGLAKSIRTMSLQAGEDFEIVAVSFDPRETPQLAAENKHEYIRRYGQENTESGWHFLTGNAPEIDALTTAAGFRYSFDETTGQYAHASGIIVATPQGISSRYLFGIDYPPRDLRLGLVEASGGKIGSLADQVLLYCYLYDPKTGKYGLVIMRVLRAGGIATVLALATFMLVMFRRDWRARLPADKAIREVSPPC